MTQPLTLSRPEELSFDSHGIKSEGGNYYQLASSDEPGTSSPLDQESFSKQQELTVKLFNCVSNWYLTNYQRRLNIEDIEYDIDYVTTKDKNHVIVKKVAFTIISSKESHLLFERNKTFEDESSSDPSIEEIRKASTALFNERVCARVAILPKLPDKKESSPQLLPIDPLIKEGSNSLCVFSYAAERRFLEMVLALETLPLARMKELALALSPEEQALLFEKFDDRRLPLFQSSSYEYGKEKFQSIIEQDTSQVNLLRESLLSLPSIVFIKQLSSYCVSVGSNLQHILGKLINMKLFNLILNLNKLPLTQLKELISLLPPQEKEQILKMLDDRWFFSDGSSYSEYSQTRLDQIDPDDSDSLEEIRDHLRELPIIKFIEFFNDLCQKNNLNIFLFLVKLSNESLTSQESSLFNEALNANQMDESAFLRFISFFFDNPSQEGKLALLKNSLSRAFSLHQEEAYRPVEGSFNQFCIPEKPTGRSSCTPIAIQAAIKMLNQHPFTPSLINDLLSIGVDIYNQIIAALKRAFGSFLDFGDVCTELFLQQNHIRLDGPHSSPMIIQPPDGDISSKQYFLSQFSAFLKRIVDASQKTSGVLTLQGFSYALALEKNREDKITKIQFFDSHGKKGNAAYYIEFKGENALDEFVNFFVYDLGRHDYFPPQSDLKIKQLIEEECMARHIVDPSEKQKILAAGLAQLQHDVSNLNSAVFNAISL
jgi:hypothetical protein